MTALAAARRARQRDLLAVYDTRVPRYTSYPTAVQFTPAVGPEVYAEWLADLPLSEPVSIYAHIPFCARLCWYCGCNTRVLRRRDSIRNYVDLLREEIELVRQRISGRARATSIHLGGGTPNMLSATDLGTLFEALREAFDLAEDAEIAAELDPAQLTATWARAAVRQGLNRASLGVQDLSPAVQAAVNRIEPFEVVARAADALRSAGVAALNFDLMYGLPRQAVGDVLNTLDQVLALAPDRIALFGYAHVPWMKPHQKLLPEAELPDAVERLAQSQAAAARLADAGYVAIGMDHFARPEDPMAVAQTNGALHRNFQGYTADHAETLLGFGASAISQLSQGYVQNQSSELLWREAVGQGRLPTARGVRVSDEDRFRGEVIERLMCDFRIDLTALAARHGRSVSDLVEAIDGLSDMARDGLVTVREDVVSVTELGRPFVRSACAAFDAYLDRAAVRHSRVV